MAAEFDLLGGLISPDVKKQFDDLNKYAEESSKKMYKLAQQKDAIFGTEVDSAKLITKLQKQDQIREQQLQQSNNKLLLMQKKFDDAMAQLAEKSAQRQARANKSKEGYLNELKQTVKELEVAYWGLNKAEFDSAQVGGKMLQTLTAKREELAKAKAAYGDNTMYVGQYSRATNGLRQSFMMLAGEMPNFAQSFRIGLMSLSNNWMGLSQAISMAKAEQKDLMKQFKDGLIDKKPDSVIKMITKSMLSFNLVLMVGVTLMQLYGEDIAKWVEEMIEGANAAKKLAKSINEVTKEAGELMKGKKQKVNEFIHDYKVAFQNGDKEMLKMLEERGAKEYDLNKHQLSLIVSDRKNAATDIFKDYLMKAENAYYDEVIIKKKIDAQITAETALTSAQNLFRAGSNNKSVKGKVSTGIFGEKEFSWDDLVKKAYDGSLYEHSFEALAIYGIAQEVIDQLRIVNAQNKIIKNLPKLRNKSYVLDSNTPTGSGGSKKQFTEINVKREYYQAEEAMMKRLADLENDITKENEDGVLNSYDKRSKAADLYYRTVEQLALQEKFISIENEKQKTEAAKRSNQQKYENNVTRFGVGSKEAIQSANELAVGNATLEANEADAILKINDDYTKKIIAAAKKRSKDLLSIDKDMYQDEVYLLEQKEQRQLKFADQDTASLGEMGLGVLGIKTDKSFKKEQRKRNIRKDKLLKQQANATGDDYKNIWNELNAIRQEEEDALILETMQKTEDAKASIVESSIETLKSLWDSYYQYQEDKIDEQLEIQTKANDERVSQYEDETDAGKHTADELKEYKANATAYQTAQEEEAARKKKELDKEQFLMQQALALASVWINYAMTMAQLPKANTAIVSQAGAVGIPIAGAYTGATASWVTAAAIAQTALIAAQTIPAFEKGGKVEEDTWATVSEKRQEYGITKEGKLFLTPKKPSLMFLEKDTTIYPDVNKMDLDHFNMMQHGLPIIQQDDRLLDEIKMLRSDLKRQKTPQINGLRLMQQLQMNQKVIGNRRGLLN